VLIDDVPLHDEELNRNRARVGPKGDSISFGFETSVMTLSEGRMQK
jgi:hypothetical protein